MKEAGLRHAYQQRDQRARTGWQQAAKAFRKGSEDAKAEGSFENRQGGTSGNSGQKQRTKTSHSSPSQNDVQAQHLKTLGLKPRRKYSSDKIKKAYHRIVMKVHPDAGGCKVVFIAVQNAY